VQHPLPTPQRCFKLGQALGRALESYPADLRVLVLGTGGLSHQLDGRRAGFINRRFDLLCLDKIAHDPHTLALLSTRDLVAEAGTQGVELVMWLAARGTLRGTVTTVHQHYHVPISNTAAGAVLLQHG
jgi:protocatechuate 4,5-dioxygenase beta chain